MASSSGAFAQCTTVNNPGFGRDFNLFAGGAGLNSIIATLNTVNIGSLGQSTAFVGSPGNTQPDQEGGGVWARAVGGNVETKSNSATNRFIDSGAGPLASGVDNCHTITKQEFVGTQVGFDIARHRFNGGATNYHLGVTTGYFEVSSKDKTPGQGTFSSESQVPFAGIYASLNSGNFSADGQLRWDFYRNQLNDPSQALFRQEMDVRNVAFSWNSAYRFDLPQRWFIEPSVGGVWSRAEIDSLSMAGQFVALGNAAGSSPGIVKIDDITSMVGRASLRVGTVYQTGNVALLPFATVSMFHEFASAVKASTSATDGIISGDPTQTRVFTSNTTSSRVGTYGHVGLGLAGTIVNTGWLGYVRADYRTGENLEGMSVNAGVRYQFAPPKELQAGLKDGHSTAPGRFDWTGLYAGAMAGMSRSWHDLAYVNDGIHAEPNPRGYLAGGQIGYNVQHGRVVFGAEFDAALSSASGGRACSDPSPTAVHRHFMTCSSDLDSLMFLAGRIGYASDRTLLYLKGGAAFGEVSAKAATNAGANVLGSPIIPAGSSTSHFLTGWGLGAGVEFALTERWTAKAEYMRYDLGKATYILDTSATGAARGEFTGDTVRVGINYHFGK